jgi:hypothetical protein
MTGTPRLIKEPLTLYVSPATYLPARVEFAGLREDYRWLALAAANLARLTVRVPPGFRRVAGVDVPPGG